MTAAPADIANKFVEKYYKIFHTDRAKLYRFYSEDAYLLHADGSEERDTVQGLAEIKKVIEKLPRVLDVQRHSVDAHPCNDGLVLLVTGSMNVEEQGSCMFAQTFFLTVPKGKGNYFVINDVFRFVQPEPRAPPQANDSKIAEEQVVPPVPDVQTEVSKTPEEPAQPAQTSDEPEEPQDAPVPEPPKVETSAPKGPMSWAQIALGPQTASETKSTPIPNKTPKTATATNATTAPNAPAAEPEKPATALYLKGVTSSLTRDDITEHFGKYGEIKVVDIKEAKDFAFVEFEDPQVAAKALEEKTVELKGVALTVEPRHSKAGAGQSNARGRGKPRGRGGRGEGDRGGRKGVAKGRGGRRGDA